MTDDPQTERNVKEAAIQFTRCLFVAVLIGAGATIRPALSDEFPLHVRRAWPMKMTWLAVTR